MGDRGLPRSARAGPECPCNLCLVVARIVRNCRRFHGDFSFAASVLTGLRIAATQVEDYIDLYHPREGPFVAAAGLPPPLPGPGVSPVTEAKASPAQGELDPGKRERAPSKEDTASSAAPASSSKRRSRQESSQSKEQKREKKRKSSDRKKDKKRTRKVEERSPSSKKERSPVSERVKEEPSPSPDTERKKGERKASPVLELPRIPTPPRRESRKRSRTHSPGKPPGNFVLRPRTPSRSPRRKPSSALGPREPPFPPPNRQRERAIKTRSKGVQRDKRNEDIYRYGCSKSRKDWREDQREK